MAFGYQVSRVGLAVGTNLELGCVATTASTVETVEIRDGRAQLPYRSETASDFETQDSSSIDLVVTEPS